MQSAHEQHYDQDRWNGYCWTLAIYRTTNKKGELMKKRYQVVAENDWGYHHILRRFWLRRSAEKYAIRVQNENPILGDPDMPMQFSVLKVGNKK